MHPSKMTDEQLRLAIAEIRNYHPELFEDGLDADLHEEGITRRTDAYMLGFNDALNSINGILDKYEKDGNEPIPTSPLCPKSGKLERFAVAYRRFGQAEPR